VTPFSILDSLLSVERMKADISNMVRRWIMAGTNASGYLADDCQLVAEARVRQLRSANTQTLVGSWTRSSFGDPRRHE